MVGSAWLLLVLLAPPGPISPGPTLAERQAQQPRVMAARQAKEAIVRQRFAAAGVAYPAAQMLLRVLKHEAELEVWAADRGAALRAIVTFPVCAASGVLGPKRREGDLQVPEGFYRIDLFNPVSSYHLSMGIDYPNASDRVLSDARRPGGDIMIHGDCVTIGCVPIEDGPIEELYVMALDAFSAGATVHVHVFPRRLDADGIAALTAADPVLHAFWKGLVPGWAAFETTRKVPVVTVDGKTGAYRVREGR